MVSWKHGLTLREALECTTDPKLLPEYDFLPIPIKVGKEFIRKLREGEIVAKGNNWEDKPNDKQFIVPPSWWAFFRLDFNNSTATETDKFRENPSIKNILIFQPEDVPNLNDTISSPELDPYKSGAPGKPTIMHMVVKEFKARVLRGVCEPGVGKESEALKIWAAQTYPNVPTLTAKTIENNIRDLYNQLVRNKPPK
ncbi:hypothetical protein ACFLQ0_04500 [Nitrospinota bacterium]